MKILVVIFCILASTLAQSDCKLNVENILGHLRRLNETARLHNNNRAAGTTGYQASVDFILSTLRQTNNFEITIQDFPFTTFRVIGTPKLAQTAPNTKYFVYNTDFRVFSGSSSAYVTAPTFAVKNQGCNDSDYDGFPLGGIAVVQRGVCSFTEKVVKAQQFRAAAVIIYNNNDGPIFSAQTDAQATTIGVYSVSAATGSLLIANGVHLTIDLITEKKVETTFNIIADTINGNPNKVVVVGSHLDSVPAGPGINDNGSGSATNLEIALEFAKCNPSPTNRVRFAWWGAEELGLLGSTFYVNFLATTNPAELSKIALNINIDMLGSPNYFFGIYNGAGAAPIIREKCIEIQLEFVGFMRARGKPYSLTPFDGRSDYGPFIEQGIPAGGLFSGAEVVKTSAERLIFGGLANAAYDPCYHAYCDTSENISEDALDTFANAAFFVILHYSITSDLEVPKRIPGARYFTNQHPDAISRY